VDVVVSGDRAYIFYFVHQGGKDGEGHAPEWQRHTILNVAELEFIDGRLTCDRNKPTRIALTPDVGLPTSK
jgi:ketosteroid isomerase-like protein